jgi:Leucine-rich repeat (LRR) protein
MKNNSSSNSSERSSLQIESEICIIDAKLITEITGVEEASFNRLQILDLHLKNDKKGKIRKIENMILTPKLKQLNLSYNAISKIEGLDRLRGLIELNLAENAITKV